MGVPGFFWYIKSKYPMTVEKVSTVSMIPQCDNLLIDVNALIHDATHNSSSISFNTSYEVFASRLMVELDKIIMFLNPQKLVYIAVDGTVPRNKMNQQRQRRFMATEEQMNVPSEIEDSDVFDTNCITPGTDFMEHVNNIIQYYISLRISTDPVWKKVVVLYSSHRCPGEGEHKIIDYLRQTIANGTYDDNDHTMCYGGDADLILLTLTLHKNNINIIRKDEYYDSTWEMKHLIYVTSCSVTD